MNTTRPAAALAAMTPAGIDAAWAPIAGALAEAQATRYELERGLRLGKLNRWQAENAPAKLVELEMTIAELTEQDAPYLAEWNRRGGWTRVFWCTANGGHAHRSLSCRTLYIGTGMVWLPEHSGADEAELVELAGASACSVCYPSAPVVPSQLRPAVEAREAKAARDAELAAKREAKAAKAITAPDGSPLRVMLGGYRESIATVATAWRLAVEGEADHLLYGYSFGEDKRAARAQIVEALAAKLGRTVDDVEAEVARKVAAKVKRG